MSKQWWRGQIHDPKPNSKHQRKSASDLRPSAAKSRRGGRRPGAGAPKGNMNALKTGAYSKQFALLGALFAQDPTVRDALLAIGRKHNLKRQKANEVAARIFAGIIDHARQISGGGPVLSKAEGLNLDLPADDWESIKATAAKYPAVTFGSARPAPAANKIHVGINQPPGTNLGKESKPCPESRRVHTQNRPRKR